MLYAKLTILNLFILSLALSDVEAQILQSRRFEAEISDVNEAFKIIPVGSKGIFLYRPMIGVKEDQIQLVKLDTTFSQQWNGLIAIKKDYMLMGQRAFNDKLYLLFRYKDYTRNDLNLIIVESNGDYTSYTVKSYIAFAPSEFQVTNNSVLIGGYYNKVPVVLYYSLKTFTSRVLPGLFNEAGELTQLRTYNDDSFDVLICAKNIERQKTVWIKSYDPDGSLIQNLPLETEQNMHLIFGRSVKADQQHQYIAGVYGNRSSEFSRGIFITNLEPSGLQETRYYNFGDLENFFKYMKAKREKRVKERIQRRKIKGKKIRFNYRFLVHEIVPYKDQYVLLGEAFYPKYRDIERNHYSFFNANQPNVIIRNGRIFEGYYYTHAVVMGFDKKGRLLWDNSFEINDIRTFTLEQFVKLEVQDDKVALLYFFNNELRTKIIKGNHVLEGKTSDPIKAGENNYIEKESTSISKLEYWYEKYLCAYGVHDVVSFAEGTNVKIKRKVFFINKISYQ